MTDSNDIFDAFGVEEVKEEIPRRPWLSGLFSLMMNGLGQLYNSQPDKALAFLAATLALMWASLATPWLHSFSGLVTWFASIVLVKTLAVGEALWTARRRAVAPRWWNRPSACVGFLIIWLLVTGLWFPTFLHLKSFHVPSASMVPTIHPGDYLYADMTAFETRGPKRGDIVVYHSPDDSRQQSLHRVLGLGGETLELRDKQVWIDGERLDDPWAHFTDEQTYSSSQFFSPALRLRDNLGPIQIPEGSVFVMGDSRDNTLDSRFLGPIPEENILGRALYVYWSEDWDRIGQELGP